MIPLQRSLEEAIAQSYQLYQEKGPRSPEKLRPLHGWFAETLRNRLDPQRFSIQDLNTEGGEAQIEGPLLSQTRRHSYSFQEGGNAIGCS